MVSQSWSPRSMAVRLSIMAVEARVQVPLFSCFKKTSGWLISSVVAASAVGTRAIIISPVSAMLRIRVRILSLPMYPIPTKMVYHLLQNPVFVLLLLPLCNHSIVPPKWEPFFPDFFRIFTIFL